MMIGKGAPKSLVTRCDLKKKPFYEKILLAEVISATKISLIMSLPRCFGAKCESLGMDTYVVLFTTYVRLWREISCSGFMQRTSGQEKQTSIFLPFSLSISSKQIYPGSNKNQHFQNQPRKAQRKHFGLEWVGLKSAFLSRKGLKTCSKPSTLQGLIYLHLATRCLICFMSEALK